MSRPTVFLLALALVGLAAGAAGYRAGAGIWPNFAASNATADTTPGESRRVLYYRNPMGLPDVSPEPKKDWMGMDYIPVYEGEEQADGATVTVSLDRVQRSGVRTELAERRRLSRTLRIPGTVTIDERRLQVVTLRADGFIEEVMVKTTGETVRAGAPLLRFTSREIQQAQVDYQIALRNLSAREADREVLTQGLILRLRNLGVPESRIRALRDTTVNPPSLEWPTPMTGTVLEKRVVQGQLAKAGDELYRIADLSTIWVIADVAEQDLALATIGAPASVSTRAHPGRIWDGQVNFIYPDLRAETRTARVRIELANTDGKLMPDMYADVALHAGAESAPVVAVPDSAVIDSGTRQIVLIAKGEGRFEPRAVKLGRRGDGYVEILEGVIEGEAVVTAATFLIDAESNLKSALKAFTAAETWK